MHVLVIPSEYPQHDNDLDGCFFRDQAIALRRLGCKVGVIDTSLISLRCNPLITIKKSFQARHELDHGIQTLRQSTFRYPWSYNVRSWQFLRTGRSLASKYIATFGTPDVLHVGSILWGGLIAKTISKHLRIPYVISELSTLYARNRIRPREYVWANQIARTASRRFAVSSPYASLLESRLKDGGEWDVRHLHVHNSFFSTAINQSQNRSQTTFLTVALLSRKKGIHILLRAFAQVFRGRHDFQLQIGGDGPARQELSTLCDELGIAPQVQFLGKLNHTQVIAAMTACDFFVLPSLFETFGLVAAEALALGKPVIATRCGGPEDIVRNEDGILVEAGNIEGMAKALGDIVAQRTRFNSKTIRASCKSRFSETNIAQQYVGHYDQILNSKSPNS